MARVEVNLHYMRNGGRTSDFGLYIESVEAFTLS